jgi:hypothetical protein
MIELTHSMTKNFIFLFENSLKIIKLVAGKREANSDKNRLSRTAVPLGKREAIA